MTFVFVVIKAFSFFEEFDSLLQVVGAIYKSVDLVWGKLFLCWYCVAIWDDTDSCYLKKALVTKKSNWKGTLVKDFWYWKKKFLSWYIFSKQSLMESYLIFPNYSRPVWDLLFKFKQSPMNLFWSVCNLFFRLFFKLGYQLGQARFSYTQIWVYQWFFWRH